jgi:hypothetical protein
MYWERSIALGLIVFVPNHVEPLPSYVGEKASALIIGSETVFIRSN